MASVLSVNVGLPHDVEWQGKTIRTAIWKPPVPGRVFAGWLNLTCIGDFLAPWSMSTIWRPTCVQSS